MYVCITKTWQISLPLHYTDKILNLPREIDRQTFVQDVQDVFRTYYSSGSWNFPLKLSLAFTDFASSIVIKIIKYQLSRARNQTVLNYCDENLTKEKAMISDEVIKKEVIYHQPVLLAVLK